MPEYNMPDGAHDEQHETGQIEIPTKGEHERPWYVFDGNEFKSIKDPIDYSSPGGDYNAALADIGFETPVSTVSEFGLYSVATTFSQSGRGVLIEFTADSSYVVGSVICVNFPAFLKFNRDFLVPMISVNYAERIAEIIDRIEETILDGEVGIESARRDATRKRRQSARKSV